MSGAAMSEREAVTARRAFWQGVAAVSPLCFGIVAFGFVAGAIAPAHGLDAWWGPVFSLVIFAGSSQVAALDLIGGSASGLVVVGTALVVNLRMLMYSAALAPYFADLSPLRRLAGSYLLTDQAFALSIARFGDDTRWPHRWPYYLGTALPLWLLWQLSTIVGAVLGTTIPDSIPLTFAIPLTFLALLVPVLVDRATLAAGVVAAAFSTAAAGLPANLALPIGAALGVAAGYAVTPRRPAEAAA